MKSYELATIYILSIQAPFKNLLLVILSSQLPFENIHSAKDIIIIPKLLREKYLIEKTPIKIIYIILQIFPTYIYIYIFFCAINLTQNKNFLVNF